MDIKDLVEAVEIARLTADATSPYKEQPLPNIVTDWHGYGTRPMTLFLNTLCRRIPSCRYVEFGSFAGRSLLAAAYGNAGTFTGVDDHRWLGQGARKFETRAALLAKLTAAVELARSPDNTVQMVTADVTGLGLVGEADVFFYDAGHNAAETRDGIVSMARALKPGVLLMDDFQSSKWREVPVGTVAGLRDARLKIHRHWALPYHTGVGVWVVEPE